MAGTELEHLVGALDRLRTTFRWKADDLDAAGLSTRIASSDLTLGGLLKHLAAVEDIQFTVKLTGGRIGEPWESTEWRGGNDWLFSTAADDSPEQLYAYWDDAVRRSRDRLGAALTRRRARPAGRPGRPRRHPREPAPDPVRPGRGVRAAHRARRPAPRGGRRPGRRGPAGRLARGVGPLRSDRLTARATIRTVNVTLGPWSTSDADALAAAVGESPELAVQLGEAVESPTAARGYIEQYLTDDDGHGRVRDPRRRRRGRPRGAQPHRAPERLRLGVVLGDREPARARAGVPRAGHDRRPRVRHPRPVPARARAPREQPGVVPGGHGRRVRRRGDRAGQAAVRQRPVRRRDARPAVHRPPTADRAGPDRRRGRRRRAA